MLLVDVNVLIYAHREDARDHDQYRVWIQDLINGPANFGIAELVLSAFLRIVTNPRIFAPPHDLEAALKFAEHLRGQSNCVVIAPGERHWEIFTDLCRRGRAKANLVPDAYLAALAIESGSEWITTDRGFGRWPGLRWRHPFDA